MRDGRHAPDRAGLACWTIALGLGLGAAPGNGQGPPAGKPDSAPARKEGVLTAAAVVARSQAAFFAAGRDMHARVTMRLIDRQGRERVRELTMLRLDVKGDEQRYFIYFHSPADVRGMTFMVWKHAGDDDRWLFVPAINLVRRLAADDSRASFVGSDFTYEDISGRDVEADTHTLQGEGRVGDRTCYVVESVPRQKDGAEYRRKVAWIDRGSLLPLKEEYYDRKGKLYRVFTADEVRQEGDYPTVVVRTMRDLERQHRTEVRFDRVEYDVGLEEGLFTERYLRRPPERWVR